MNIYSKTMMISQQGNKNLRACCWKMRGKQSIMSGVGYRKSCFRDSARLALFFFISPKLLFAFKLAKFYSSKPTKTLIFGCTNLYSNLFSTVHQVHASTNLKYDSDYLPNKRFLSFL